MLFAAVGNALVAVLTGEVHHVAITRRGMLAVLYLVVFGSWVGYTAYIWLLKHVPTPKVATYAYVNPLVALSSGVAGAEASSLTPSCLAGTVIIVAGVALVTTAKVRQGSNEAPMLTEIEPDA